MAKNDLRVSAAVVTVLLLLIPSTGRCMDPVDVDGVQAALRAYRAGRHRLSEQLALELADRSGEPVPRAWLIAAEARRKLGRATSATEAYRQFLASCESPRLREYVQRRLRETSPRDRQNVGPELVAEALAPREMDELGSVDREQYVETTEHFVVRAHNARLARLVARRAEQSLRGICGVLLGGQAWPHTVDIHVWADREHFRRHAEDAPDYSGGNFTIRYGPEGIVRRIDLTQLDEEANFEAVMIDRVLPHELSHLVLHEFFGESHCPLFLDEGLAMLAEAEADDNRIVLAGAALAAGRHIPMPQLFLTTREDLDDPAVFYAQAFSFVEYLRGRMSRGQFRRFLENVKSGSPFAEAVQRALYVPPDEEFLSKLAAAWQDYAVAQAQYIRALRGEPGLLENASQ
ncbi:MAG: peptidase MA family metallohydrolase [Phycisphaerae bacterium]